MLALRSKGVGRLNLSGLNPTPWWTRYSYRHSYNSAAITITAAAEASKLRNSSAEDALGDGRVQRRRSLLSRLKRNSYIGSELRHSTPANVNSRTRCYSTEASKSNTTSDVSVQGGSVSSNISLSETNYDAYSSALSEIFDPLERSLARRTLGLLALSQRPLLIGELKEYLLVEFDLEPSDVEEFFKFDSLKALVTIENGGLVSLSHHSVKQYLLSTQLASSGSILSYYAIDKEQGNAEIACTLLSYLSTKHFESSGPCTLPREWRQREKDYPLLSYASNSWHLHCRDAGSEKSSLVDLASKFWTTDIKSSYGVWMQAYRWSYKPRYTADYIDGSTWGWTMWRYLEQDTSPIRQLASWGLTEFAEAALSHPQHASEKSEALLCAVENGHLDTAAMLLGHGADPKETTADAQTTLHLACVSDNEDVLQMVLSSREVVHLIDEINCKGETALHIAARLGNSQMVKMLLAHGATVDVFADLGCSPLYHAAEHGHPEVVNQLLEAGANPDGLKYLRSPLHGACYQKDADWDDARRRRALQLIEELLKAGADPMIRDADDVTPLCIAASKDHTEVVEVLARHISQEDINAATNWDCADDTSTALDMAVASGASLETVRALVDLGARSSSATHPIPLSQAFQHSNMDVIKYLCEKFPDSVRQQVIGDSETSCLSSTEWGWLPKPGVLEYIWTLSEDKEFLKGLFQPMPGHAMHTFLHCGLLHKIIERAQKDPKFEKTVEWYRVWTSLSCSHWNTPLKFEPWRVSMEQLLQYRPELNTPENWRTALYQTMYCSEYKPKRALYLLEKIEAMMSLSELHGANAEGNVWLHLACDEGYETIASRLLAASKNEMNAQNEDGITPLMSCFIEAHEKRALDTARVLLENGADVTIQDNKGKTALAHAISSACWLDSGREIEAIELLLAYGADKTLDIRTNKGFRPIDLACEENMYGVVKILEDAGSEFRTETDGGTSLLHTASVYSETGGWHPLIDRLIEKMELAGKDWWDVEFLDTFHGPADYSYFRRLILGRPSNSNLISKSQNGVKTLNSGAQPITALAFAAATQYNPGKAYVMLKYCTPEEREEILHGRFTYEDCNYDPTETEQNSLHLFMRCFNMPAVRWLVAAGADVNAVDSEGRTPLYFANRRGNARTHIEGCGEEAATAGYYLLEAGADVNYRNPKTGESAYQTILTEPRSSVKKCILKLLADHGAEGASKNDYEAVALSESWRAVR